MKDNAIIIADDHPLLLKGLNDFLVERNYNIIGSANDGREAYNLIAKTKPDIAILDIQMPYLSGLEIAQQCKTNSIDTKIVLITLHKEKELYQQAQDLNIFGYILKEFALEEIEHCIKTVSSGNYFFSPKIKSLIGYNANDKSALSTLTPSERKILKLIANDKTNKEIASFLFISYRTVEKHRSNIIKKLGITTSQHALIVWIMEHPTCFD